MTNLQSDTVMNDSTLVLIYKDQIQGKVSVSMNGTCRYLSDSIAFKVLPTVNSISLGPDVYLCLDSELVLPSRKGICRLCMAGWIRCRYDAGSRTQQILSNGHQ
jgi:hypothetical protein